MPPEPPDKARPPQPAQAAPPDDCGASPISAGEPAPLLKDEAVPEAPHPLAGLVVAADNSTTKVEKSDPADRVNEPEQGLAVQGIWQQQVRPRLSSWMHRAALVGSVIAAGLTVWAENHLGVPLLAPESKNLLHTGASAIIAFVNAAEFSIRREPGSRWFSVGELFKAGNLLWAVVSLLILIDAISGQSLSTNLTSVVRYLLHTSP